MNKPNKVVAGAVAVAIASSIGGYAVLSHNFSERLSAEQRDTLLLRKQNEDINAKIQEVTGLNEDLTKYISDHAEMYKRINQIMHDNEELKKENEALKQYRSIKGAPISRGGSPEALSTNLKVTKIKVEVSMYTNYDAGCTGTTASGTKARWGTIAAPSEIPFGAEMIIEAPSVIPKGAENIVQKMNSTVFRKEDVGGYIKKVGDTYRIDVWVDSTSKAQTYGRHVVDAYIIEKQ